MPTKYEYIYSKPIKGNQWKHIVAICFMVPNAEDQQPDIGPKQRRSHLSLQQEFLKFMAEQYGPQDGRWSVRWSDYGADVRFRSEKDAGSFILFFTENPSKNYIDAIQTNW